MKTLRTRAVGVVFVLFAVAAVSGCQQSETSSGGTFFLIEFLDSGKDNIPRNRTLVFRFSSPVALGQDLPERLKIQNVQAGAGQSDFSRAIGQYFISAEVAIFVPRLPEKPDRSDAGFRSNGNYHVFLKAGPDGLTSTSGDQIVSQQEYLFDTNDRFEDPNPTEPPRALQLIARDNVTGATHDISRLDPRPSALGQLDSSELLAALDAQGLPAPRALEPGAGGAPNFSTPWQLELYMSEPIDPSTVTTDNIEMFEVRKDALDGATTANPGTMGTAVSFKVPITVNTVQTYDVQGNLLVYIQVNPIQTLVDDARYRINFSGNILGIDFSKKFIGENGLTGDGETILSQTAAHGTFHEPGGLGYTADFLVYDRPAITATRTVTYDPNVDGVNPELGNTTLSETLFNGAQYNAPSGPGLALGVIGNFGQGDENFSVSGANTAELDTGDQPNELNGNPFSANGPDVDPNDTYKNGAGLPAPAVISGWDSLKPTSFEYGSFTISSSARLDVIGVNPCRIVCTGLVTVNGVLNAGGGDGGRGWSTGGTSNNNANTRTTPGFAGVAGPGGWNGGQGDSPGTNQSQTTTAPCNASQGFDAFLNMTGANKTLYPASKKGEGPGRGQQGGEGYVLTQATTHNDITGTGGGGGSYATMGERGEDRWNNIGKTSTLSNGQPGRCGRWGAPNSGLIGMRGMPGPTYGDRELLDITAGGSGAGSGGGMHGWYNAGGGVASGGGGGGGGGFLEIISAGAIVVSGGIVSVAGGDGGLGAFQSLQNGRWTRVAGSGGGGAGGGLSLISTTEVNLSGAIIDARGGTGGARPNNPPAVQSCTSCNAGGDGGKGFIHLMDPDGIIPALGTSGFVGNYDSFEFGVLSVRQFDPTRFGGIAAVTELFNVRAANPDYLATASTDIVGNVNAAQTIIITMSTAKGDADDPLRPDLITELLPAIEIARVVPDGGGSAVNITGDSTQLNQFGTPDREAFLRVIAEFDYDDPSQAALGPFASLDEVTTTFTFNG